MYKFLVLAAVVAVANAGYATYGVGSPYAYGGPSVAYAAPAITSQASNILRTPGNLGQISTYQKSIDTPFSSVRKSDVRVSNDALAYGGYHAPAIAAYGAPAYRAFGAPAYRAYGAPAYAYGAPAYRTAVAAPHGLIGTAYSAAPAVAHLSFNGLGVSYGY